MKTALYMRVSTMEQATEGYSLASQKRKLLAYCEAMNWSVYKIYSDEGISGASITKRPAATQMLKDVKNGEIENVLIMKVDRLCRNTKDLLEIVDILKKYNVRLNAVDEKIDYTTDVGKMVLTLLGSFAEFERNRITQRMSEGRTQKVLSGIKSRAGVLLYGYDYIDGHYHKKPLEAMCINKVFNLALEHKSIHEIARIMAHDTSNANNKEWDCERVRRILRNPTYKGYTFTSFYRNGLHYNYDALMVKAVNVDPIVDEITWDNVNNILRSRNGKTQRKYSIEDFVFGDVAYCGVCGYKMYARNSKSNGNSGKRRYYYRCQYKRKSYNLLDNVEKCPVNCVENSTAERNFLNYFENLELNPVKPNELTIDETKLIEEIKLKLKQLDKKRNSLSKKFVEDLISADTYSQINNEYTNEYTLLENELNNLENKKSAIIENFDYDTLLNIKVTLRDMWGIMSKSEKRNFITLHFEKVYITKNCITKVIFRKAN